MLFTNRECERTLYDIQGTANSNYNECEFPQADAEEMNYMECEFSNDPEGFCLFLFLRTDVEEKNYVDIYVWDCMLYPEIYHRFVIANGVKPDPDTEKLLLYYIREIYKGNGNYNKYYINEFLSKAKVTFPEWHLEDYSYMYLAEALSNMYFASFRSGIRELLYKSELNHIGFNLDAVYEYDVFASSPERLLGKRVPLKLLRILNKPSLVNYLYAQDTIDVAIGIYEAYSDYVTDDKLSDAQFEYLERLYMCGGVYGGKGFSRAVFNKLAGENCADIVDLYGRFLEAKREVEGIGIRLPQPENVEDETIRLETYIDYKNGRADENSMVSIRSAEAEFEYEDNQYLVRLPKSGEEMCMEAIKQHNCLGEYVYRHAIGKTTIVFLRKKSRPDKSYVTMEISENEIVQVFKQCNQYPDCATYSFIERYAEIKGFDYNPHRLIRTNSWIDFLYDAFGIDVCDTLVELDKYLLEYDKKHSKKVG